MDESIDSLRKDIALLTIRLSAYQQAVKELKQEKEELLLENLVLRNVLQEKNNDFVSLGDFIKYGERKL